ncbi:MAG TPA: AI-2E family transporter, partial [Polyangiaceae bacterium]|nr:AI-2E family transporter [Polyangiaceae bacterium]
MTSRPSDRAPTPDDADPPGALRSPAPAPASLPTPVPAALPTLVPTPVPAARPTPAPATEASLLAREALEPEPDATPLAGGRGAGPESEAMPHAGGRAAGPESEAMLFTSRRTMVPESEAMPRGGRRTMAPESEAMPRGGRRTMAPESEAFSRRRLGRVSALDDGANELARRLASPSTSRQRRALAIFALAGAIGLVSVALPVGAGLLLGGFVGFSLQPVYERLTRRLRPGTAAFACAAGSGAAIAGTFAALAFLFVDRGAALVEHVPALLARGGPVSRFVERAARQSAVVRLRPGEIDEKLNERVAELASGVPTVAAQVAGAALNALLTVFFMTITTYFVLRRWDRLVRRAELLLPLHPRHTRALFVQLRDVGRHVLVGTVLT